jgi:hypothetical protein
MSPKLQIEVREAVRRLVVTMPGTRYSMEFVDNNGRLGLMSGFGQNDKRVSLTAREFAVLAEKAAREKTLELGWSKQPGMRSRAWVEKQAKR